MNKSVLFNENLEMEKSVEQTLNLKELLNVLSSVKNGRLSIRMSVKQAGIEGRICEVLNDII
jgi:hypothetical protein